MPKVGTGKNARHYPYTPAGERAARQDASRTGQPMKRKSLPKPPRKGK